MGREHPPLAPALSGTVSKVGVNPTLKVEGGTGFATLIPGLMPKWNVPLEEGTMRDTLLELALIAALFLLGIRVAASISPQKDAVPLVVVIVLSTSFLVVSRIVF